MKIVTNYSIPNFRGVTVDLKASKMLRDIWNGPDKAASRHAKNVFNEMKCLSNIGQDLYVKYDEDKGLVKITEEDKNGTAGFFGYGKKVSSDENIVDAMEMAVKNLTGNGDIELTNMPKDN